MAFISFQPSDHYSTKLYTGTGSDNLNITGVGFQPDLTWLKNRDVTDGHVVYDAVRGATQGIWTNNTDAQAVYSGLKSFDSDGYTLGTYSDFNTSGGKQERLQDYQGEQLHHQLTVLTLLLVLEFINMMEMEQQEQRLLMVQEQHLKQFGAKKQVGVALGLMVGQME